MLPADEAEKITKLAELFPEIEEEINSISNTLLDTAAMSERSPSPELRNKVLGRLQELGKVEEKAPQAPVVTIETHKDRQARSPWNYAAAAAVAGLLILSGYLFRIQSVAKQDNERLTTQVRSLEQKVAANNLDIKRSAEMLDMYRSNNYKKILLRQLPGGSPVEVRLFWDTQTNYVYMGEMNLPAPPSDKQYQLWAIVNGKPVDAGMINGQQLQKMKAFPQADAFAITLEKRGGSPVPTMEAMVAMANI